MLPQQHEKNAPSTVLSDEDKNRIRAEEVFREEVRRELSAKKHGKLLTFLNSALGIWLLSTIVVGLFSWGYTVWNESRASTRQTVETIRRLDAEIAGRIQFLQSYLPSVRHGSYIELALSAVEQPAEQPGNPRTGGIKVMSPVFPEYHSRGLTSLLWELQTLVPESQRAPIREAIIGAQRLSGERLSASLRSYDEGDALDSGRKRVLGVLHTYFSDQRWHPFKEGQATQQLRDIAKDGWHD